MTVLVPSVYPGVRPKANIALAIKTLIKLLMDKLELKYKQIDCPPVPPTDATRQGFPRGHGAAAAPNGFLNHIQRHKIVYGKLS